MRGVAAAIASSGTEVFAYTKLPGMVFWSGIQPRKPRGWENTRIWQAGITTPAIHRIEQNGFGEFLLSRVKYIAEANLSERQQNQLQQALQKDPERSRNSHSAHVFLTELDWKIRQRRP
ncbi:hypothetical protein KSB_66360 [Ktedonobacter robiniae]|uniref:Uncharacterized protein n=1 Tax=Ktedonobacter robiniae TaxID=2778365 RepID=A0ABQ3UZ46_9CHLR|nr:hypothetical protein KSB_66360 [Ktedonobacter robiniae]